MNWIAWNKVIAPIEYGGLGFGSLMDANLAMLAKWWWRFKVQEKGLWKRVIWAIHHNSRSWSAIPAKLSIPGQWKQIINIQQHLSRKGIDLHKHTRFPSLFGIVGWRLSAVQLGQQGQEAGELSGLMGILSSVSVSSNLDSVKWGLHQSAEFTVRSIKEILNAYSRLEPGYKFVWNSWVPKKVGFVTWRAKKERLPTRAALQARNIQVNSVMCALCGDYTETSDHLFVSCSKKKKKALNAIVQALNAIVHVTMWSIWMPLANE
ncbi:uncharacterized protein LOC110876696 [Helianthus annuus]|uniref:uncharacterized protein LOC110876696 n=1 Tax=Helianthus annuus TaxID=4232 RepID=UPI001652F7BD|nr:uncharacterized protein LOC110876696 [Helianthus annuus]